jgi:hypothetical protein
VSTSTPALTTADADTILAKMTARASVRDNPTDRRAAVEFLRSGPIITWTPSPSKPGIISSDNDHDLVNSLVRANIHVVQGFAKNTKGLTDPTNMNSMAVMRRSTLDKDATLWLHETLHGAGVKEEEHRDNDDNNVMHSEASEVGLGILLNDYEWKLIDAAEGS